MTRWIEIAIALLLIVPLTQLVTKALTYSGNATIPAGMIYKATSGSVGTEGTFVLVLFKFWPIFFGLALVALIIYHIRKSGEGEGKK